MTRRFHSFAIFGAMRTGSNFLEASLSELPGITTYGEVFNPRFISEDKRTELFGIRLETREKNPQKLWNRIRENTEGMPGLRYFLDHDPRMFDALIDDPGVAKIVLSRNPVDSFVSFKIAMRTNEWLVTPETKPKQVKIRFDAAEFAEFLADTDTFYRRLRHRLRIAGQTAFEIGYDDLNNVDVLNGLAAWLGLDGRLDAPSHKLVRQNPPALEDKVSNVPGLRAALREIDAFGLDVPRVGEPGRNAAIQTYRAAAKAPLLFLPVKGGPSQRIEAWLAALDASRPAALQGGFGLKRLLAWRDEHPGHRSFTVIRHPLERAHETFAAHLLMAGPETYGKIRKALQSLYWLDFPPGAPDKSYTLAKHRQLFLDFLGFLERNLNGQTSIRVDPAWASQEAVLAGFARRQVPDRVIREDRLAQGLAELAAEIGREGPALPPAPPSAAPFALFEVYDRDIEEAARRAYGRDYTTFGFSDWAPMPP